MALSRTWSEMDHDRCIDFENRLFTPNCAMLGGMHSNCGNNCVGLIDLSVCISFVTGPGDELALTQI
jgi:hypothetical protein